jgi:hypothetical protein
MFRYLRIWIESHYGKGGGLNNLRVLVPFDDDQHFLQRQACGGRGVEKRERKGGRERARGRKSTSLCGRHGRKRESARAHATDRERGEEREREREKLLQQQAWEGE